MSNRNSTPFDSEEDDPFYGTPYQADSPTSLEGAIIASEHQSSWHRRCYDYVLAHPGSSQEGIWLGLRAESPGVKERTIGARVIELHQAGLLAPMGEVMNSTGARGVAYHVIGPYPASGIVRRGPGPLAMARAEIARLRALCEAHGIDPNQGLPSVQRTSTGVVDPNDPFLDV
jgi:hypothetical protein